MIAFKCSEKEFEQILELAKKYANGNVSAFVRYVSMNYKT